MNNISYFLHGVCSYPCTGEEEDRTGNKMEQVLDGEKHVWEMNRSEGNIEHAGTGLEGSLDISKSGGHMTNHRNRDWH